MALIYTKLTDKTTVLAPREGACRKFNFGSDWTEVRLGMFVSAIAATGSNDANVSEVLVPAGITDYVTFGIKDDSQTYPGQTGSLFIGIRSGDAGNVNSIATTGGIGDSGGTWRPAGYHDTTAILGVANGGAGTSNMGAANASGATAYCGFIVVKFVIVDLGLSTQSITMSVGTTTSVAGADYSATALRTAINNHSFGASLASIAWNDGAAARAIPDCIWVRSPLYNNALRISCVRAIRYAP
jgi:hypothetical protein